MAYRKCTVCKNKIVPEEVRPGQIDKGEWCPKCKKYFHSNYQSPKCSTTNKLGEPICWNCREEVE